jgi:TonB family protein
MRMSMGLALLFAGSLAIPVVLSGQQAGAPAAPAPAKPAEARPNPDSSGIYHAGDGVTAPKLLYAVEPEFSEIARRKKIHGNCRVSLVVGTDGNTQNVRVIRSIAEDVPEKLRPAAASLDEEALKVVKQYRFAPATFKGKPVPYETTVEVNFQIF